MKQKNKFKGLLQQMLIHQFQDTLSTPLAPMDKPKYMQTICSFCINLN